MKIGKSMNVAHASEFDYGYGELTLDEKIDMKYDRFVSNDSNLPLHFFMTMDQGDYYMLNYKNLWAMLTIQYLINWN